jgi:hypothetical protein
MTAEPLNVGRSAMVLGERHLSQPARAEAFA